MYVVVELQTDKRGIVGSDVSDYATVAEAESKYYEVLSRAALSDMPSHACTLLDGNGLRIMGKCYRRQT